MAFRVSNSVLVETPDWNEAVQFYEHTFEFPERRYEGGVEFDAGPIQLLVEAEARPSTTFELLTDQRDQARAALRIAGFQEIHWPTSAGPALVVDPFGFHWGIRLDPHLLVPPDLTEPTKSYVRAKIGLNTPRADEVAQFYADLLNEPVNRLTDGTWIVDSGSMRMRFLSSHLTFACLWLSPEAPVADLADDGCDFDGDLARDPFGVYWRIDSSPAVTHAVIQDRNSI